MNEIERRRFLRTSAIVGALVTAGCNESLGDINSTPTPANKDTDGDGVIDSEDYAPKDASVQRAEQVQEVTPTSAETKTETPTETETPTPDTSQNIDGFERETLSEWSISGNCNHKRISTNRAKEGSRSLLLSSDQGGGPCDAQRQIDVSLDGRSVTFTASLYDERDDPDGALIEYSNSAAVGGADAIRVDIDVERETRFVTFDSQGNTIDKSTFEPISPDNWYDATITVSPNNSAEIRLEDQSGIVASDTLTTSGTDRYTFVHLIAAGYAGGELFFDNVAITG